MLGRVVVQVVRSGDLIVVPFVHVDRLVRLLRDVLAGLRVGFVALHEVVRRQHAKIHNIAVSLRASVFKA